MDVSLSQVEDVSLFLIIPFPGQFILGFLWASLFGCPVSVRFWFWVVNTSMSSRFPVVVSSSSDNFQYSVFICFIEDLT